MNSLSSDEKIGSMLDRASLAPHNTHVFMEQCFGIHIDAMKTERQNLPGWKGVFYRCRDKASSIFPFPLVSDTEAASEHIEKMMRKRYERILEDEGLD